MSKVLRELGIDIPPGEDTPLVRKLVGIIERLVEEVQQLKGLPSLPKRDPAPSALHDSSTPPSKQGSGSGKKTNKPKKRKKGVKGSKFKDLKIDQTIVLEPDQVQPGAQLVGYKSFIQQELRLEVVNIRYRRPCYENSDGTVETTPRPEYLSGHYGPNLKSRGERRLAASRPRGLEGFAHRRHDRSAFGQERTYARPSRITLVTAAASADLRNSLVLNDGARFGKPAPVGPWQVTHDVAKIFLPSAASPALTKGGLLALLAALLWPACE